MEHNAQLAKPLPNVLANVNESDSPVVIDVLNTQLTTKASSDDKHLVFYVFVFLMFPIASSNFH